MKAVRHIPSIDKLLQLFQSRHQDIPPQVLKELIKESVEKVREIILMSKKDYQPDEVHNLTYQEIESEIKIFQSHRFQSVINATGTILHTGLGRAPLPAEFLHQIIETITPYTNLEYDLLSGRRGERLDHCDLYLRILSGGELSAVVNNNAAAVFLSLNTLASGKEVIVSRGQMVEIGGSFRIPEVVARSGAILKEIGTTNKTHLRDFQQAISEKTGAILITHTSNYEIRGFTHFPDLREVIELSHSRRIPIIFDLGSGAFLDLQKFGIKGEPVVHQSLELGFDLVTFSGDKLLGGPQCGIIVGKKKFMEQVRKNPIMRTVRCDKLILSILEHILYLYVKNETHQIPFYSMLATSRRTLTNRFKNLFSKKELEKLKSSGLTLNLINSSASIGSGASPLHAHPSKAIMVQHSRLTPNQLARFFRLNQPPIIGRIEQGQFLLDLITISEKQLSELKQAIFKLIEL